ncbi:MAG: hypothetical protein IKZ29_08950 [Clostridiales bacterium]|nr:hypothetical protein [Clostridiales bacterium]
MRRQIAFILTAAFAVTMFAGCNKETLVEESTIASSESSEEATAATYDPSEIPSFEEYYGPQLPNYLDHQYYFDGEAVPTNLTNFYFINTFETLSSYAYYGYYDSTATGRVNLAAEAPLGSEFATLGDLYVSEAEYEIEYDLILAKRAKEEGVVIPDDTKQTVDEMMNSITTDAAAYGLTFEEYMAHFYGPGLDEAAFREILDVYYLAPQYASDYYDKYAEEHSDITVPNVRYALFYAPDTSDQAQKDMALECANALKDTATSIDNLTELSEEAYGMGTIYDYGDIAVFKRDEVPTEFAVVPEFEEWAYSADRTENEIDIIYAPKYGYFVVGYLGYQAPEASQYQEIASYLLKNSVNEEIDSKIHDLHTDDEYLPSPAAPTATPVPTAAPTTAQDSTLPSLSTDMSGTGTATAQSGQKVDSVTVLIIVFITLACVAVLAVIVILIVYAMNNYKKENAIKAEISKSKRKAAVEDDEDEDEDEDDSEDEEESEDGDEADEDDESEEDNESEESEEAEEAGESDDSEESDESGESDDSDDEEDDE